MKKLFYIETIITLGKKITFSIYFLSRCFKNYGFTFKKVFILFLCLKTLLIDTFSYLLVKAQTENDFNLATVQSPPVSFNTSLSPTTIKLSSLPVSLNISNSASTLTLSSLPVSFNTDNLASSIKLSSNPVSYLVSQTASLIKLTSLPVSYSLDSFTGEQIKLSSQNVSYKIYNGIPILDTASPNLLPVSLDEKSIDISLQGDNFVKDSVATIGTLKIQTKYISQKELIATIPTSFLSKENNFEIFAANPPPAGGVSKGFNIMVIDPIPIAKINASPSIGVAPQIVTFDGRDTEDLLVKHFGQTLSYSWDFGNTSGEENTSRDPVVSHTYTKPGKYTTTLNIINAYGKTSSITKEIEIRDKNFAPDGNFTVDKTTGDVPLSITFTSNITDKENDTISYLWDFGDGQTSIESNPSHIYTIPGKYQPKLTIRDLLGAQTIITSNKLTLLPANNLPIVQTAALPKESILKLNNQGLFTSPIQFISNGTYDPDGEELTYLWDFGDGETGNEINPLHEYRNAGTYNVKLTVTDPRNGQRINTIPTIVSKPNPITLVKSDQSTGNAPFEVTFDGTVSQDYDGRSVTLKWDFGDGNSQITDSTESIIKHIYTDPGVYLVTVTATTPDNRFTKINPANIIVGPNNGPVGQITKLEGDEKGILGQAMVKLSASGSYDPSSTSSLKYKWSWSARTWDTNGNLIDISEDVNMLLTTGNDQDIFEYTFTTAGQFTPVLTLEKSDGTKANFYGETFTITHDQAPVAVTKILSEKTSGNPGLEISFDGSESYDPKANGGLKIITWDFGDGEKSTEVSPKHIYNSEGSFTPTLIVVDNTNNVGFAQASTVRITSTDTGNNNLLSREAIFKRYEIAASTLAESPRNDSETEIQSAIDTMAKEAVSLFILSDNKKPEIGPITIEPKEVSPGGVIKLSCFIRDNIGLSNFGYLVTDLNNKVISKKVIDLLNKGDDKVIKNEYFIDENIQIPSNITPGNYKIKLTATDTNGNQIAKESSGTDKEEIVINFEVTGATTDSSNKIILPSETSNLASRIIVEKSKKSPKKKYTKISLKETESENNEIPNLNGFFVRNRNVIPSLTGNPEQGSYRNRIPVSTGMTPSKNTHIPINTEVHNDNSPEKHNKYLIDNFQITNYTAIINPWVSISPGNSNNLTLEVISERDGYIEIGTKGSLLSTPFAKWTKTNVYIDSKKIGPVSWFNGIGISYTSNTSNPVKSVQFRPTDSNGNELSSATWTTNYFTFIKVIQPQVTSIFPTEGTVGRGAFDLRINGNNFTTTSKVYFDGYLLTPYAVSPTTLYIRVPAYLVNNIGFKTLSVLNSDGSQSTIQYYTVKANQNNPCNINKTLPQTYWGSDAQTILSGNNVYLSSHSAVIEGNGSVIIPFCTGTNHDVSISLNLNHYKNSSGGENSISFWLDGSYIGSSSVNITKSLLFNNLTTRNLPGSTHELKISFSGSGTDQLLVNSATFSNGGIILDSISPTFVTLEGTSRTLTLNGSNFDQNLNVLVDNQALAKTSVTANQITVKLPDKFLDTGPKPVQLTGNGKQSSILQLSVKNAVELLNPSFKVTPIQPFPGNSFDIELKAKNNQAGIYTATVAIYDPDGKLLTIPNTSNNYSTITLSGTTEPNSDITFKGSIPLPLQTKTGNYTAFTFIKRVSGSEEDYSSIETAQYIAARALGLSYSDITIPASHKLIFTPKPAVITVFGIEENSSDNTGFSQVASKVIQDNQSIKYKVQISSGSENASKLIYNFKSGDGRESGQTANDNYTFTYQNTNTSSTTPLTVNPTLDIFWTENGTQTKIGTYNGPTVLIYPNYSPIAKAKVSGNTYTTTPPLFTTFLDLESYDPNQRFSSAIDFVDSTKNKWDLYELKFNQDAMLISLPVDAKVSTNGKTFISGNIYAPGSYFARLTVTDKTGLTDTASTESVTLTKPSQMVIVFATTDPSDKKVYDPSIVIPAEAGIQKAGIPVKFKSTVTPLSNGVLSNTYKWDFGDGSCKGSSLPDDCTNPNPTHYYFDGKKSFNGNLFTDRKSITPKLTVTTRFKNDTSETWEASAGTITFNAEPSFVLLNISPDNTNGIVPFTVNLMIDNTTAKAVNATISKYEIDWGDHVILSDSEESQTEPDNITFDQLLTKTFTHTYTAPGTYTPKLTVYINESQRTFTFNVPAVTIAGAGVGGVYLLDDLTNLLFTNQPIVTFMVLTSFANPNDPNNSLRIRVKDEDGNESVTELDPVSQNQTISLNEGKNTYYFETSDSSNQVIMSEERSIILDTEKPVLSIESPNENNLIANSEKLIVSGTIEDKLFDSISYRTNSNSSFITISPDDLEDLDDDKKAFNIVFDPNTLNSQISKVEINVKDKAGNITSNEININNHKQVKLLNNVLNNNVQIIYNDGQPHSLKQGQPFELVIKSKICDDNKLPANKSEPAFELKTNDLSSLKIGIKDIFLKGTGTLINSNTISAYGTLGDIDGCSNDTYDVYESFILNNTSSNELFDTNAISPDPALYWPVGQYQIQHAIASTDYSKTHFGTTLENNLTELTNNFIINITRDYSADITALKSQNLLWNKSNNITFNLNLADSIPIKEKDYLPHLGQAYIQTPNGEKDNVTINCNYPPNISYPVRKLTANCSFNYTPTELTKNSSSYTLTVPVSFPPDLGNLTDTWVSFPAEYKDIKSNPEIAVKIIQPEGYTVIQSSKTLIKSILDKTKLPADLQTLTPNKIKNLAKYGIRFGSNDTVRTVTSSNNYDSIVKGIMISSLDENTIGFEYNLNFNLNTENNFKDAFDNLSAIGPIFLYNEVSTLSPLSSTFPAESYAEPQKLILIDKPSTKGTLKTNPKTNTKVLNLTVKNNIPGYGPNGKKFPLELIIEPKDATGMILGNPGDFNTSVLIPKGQLSKTKKIDNLPSETTEVKATLNRSDDFLNFIQEKLNKNSFDFNLLNGQFNTVSSTLIPLTGTQITSCSINPDTGNTSQNIDFQYNLKSTKSVSISIDGKKSDGTIDRSIPLPSPFKNKTDWAQSGIIPFTIPEEWSIYTEVIFTLSSGGESDGCSLKIDQGNFFIESSQETDSIDLSFVTNGIANIPDDPILGIKGVSFSSSGKLILKDLKQLLKDLKLLSDDNNNGFDLETQEATYELLYIIDQLRCALKDTNGNLNLKAQVSGDLLTCGISSANYLEYISTSIKTNLPYVVSLINSTNILRAIGATSPQISVTGLADSVLLRGLTNAGAIGILTAPEIASIAFVGLILYTTLSNAKLKADTNTSTCTNTFGIVDRRFFIGKDLNNNDVKRTNTMVSVSATNNLYSSNLNVIEPFPHIPLQPGIFSGCIQEGEYTFTLKFNDLSAFTMTGVVQKPAFGIQLTPVTSFWGGVFRKYGKPSTIPKIVNSKLILNTSDGDIQTILNPTGAGAYLTRVSLIPNIDISSVTIADALRLYIPGTFEVGNQDSKGEIENGKADAFIDLAIDTTITNFQTNEIFPLQYVIPNQQLQFGNPGENSRAILIYVDDGL